MGEDDLDENDEEVEDGEEEETTNEKPLEAGPVASTIASPTPVLGVSAPVLGVSAPMFGVSAGDRPEKRQKIVDNASIEKLADPTVIGEYHTGIVKTYIPST